MTRKRTVVLISGRGSNMMALVEAASDPSYPADIVRVISDKPTAAGLAKATEAGIPAESVDRKSFANKAAFEGALQARLEDAEAEIVCLAGFMRILSPEFVSRWDGRLINIHPSILPSFRGIDTHQRALDAGVRIHGCSVHFVRPDVDAGPIIAQAAIAVSPGDTPESLATRLLPAEHRLFPMALRLVASGRARVEGDHVVIEGMPDQNAVQLIVPDITAN